MTKRTLGSARPTYRIRVPDDFSLAKADLSGPWRVVPTEDGGEVAIDLTLATRLVVRERSDQDQADYERKLAAV